MLKMTTVSTGISVKKLLFGTNVIYKLVEQSVGLVQGKVETSETRKSFYWILTFFPGLRIIFSFILSAA